MPDSPSLIGRDTDLAALAAAIDADRATVVVGEAGIGKTALIRAAVRGTDRRLREGGAFATLRETPYVALARAVGAPVAGDPAAVAARIEALVGPDVLFVDDLQWADAQTLAVVELLVGRILVLAAVRSLDPGAGNALARLLACGVAFHDLQPLPGAAASSLVRARRPGLATGVVEDIVRRAAGNPLLLEEMAERGEASPVLARVMTGRLEALSPAARGVVDLLAVAERPLARGDLDAAVGETLAAGIAIEGPTGIELRHQLVADAVRGNLGSEDRRRLHGRVARLLGDGPEAARHLAAAGQAEEAAGMALRVLGASSDARERAALLVIAAEASEGAGSLVLRLEAARGLDEVADWAGVTRSLGGLDLDEASLAGTPEGVAEAHALLAHAAYSLGDVVAARGHVAAMEACPIPLASPAGVRRAIEAATFGVNVDGAVEASIGTLDRAIAGLPPAHPGIEDLAVLKACILTLALGGGDHERVHAAADGAFDAGRYRTATDRARVVQYSLLMAVGSDEALQFLLDRHAGYEAAGMQSMASEFLADAVVAAILAGRLAEAVTIADRLLEAPASPRARQTAEIQRARALVLLGQIDEGERTLEALRPVVSADYFGLGETLHGLAEAALYGGRPRDAAAFADASLAVTAPLPGGRVPRLVIRAWARHELGLPADADLGGAQSRSVVGAADELPALDAMADGAFARAAVGFDAAAAAWARFSEPEAWLCRWAAGEARRRDGATAAAAAELGAVLEAAESMSFEPLAARARRSLRLLGVRVPGRAAGSPARGPSLTVRERELVGLVERGLTNVEIARRLGLGRPTVTRILTSAMSKLGVTSRAQLAATAPSER
jgi:DNA-binding CsgD family transcriptional regulator